MQETGFALAGSIPILLVFALMAGLRWSALRAMGVGWVVASGLGLMLWQMAPAWWAAAALYGVLQALEITLIIFGAVLLMNHLKLSGAMITIRRHFSWITRDRRVQLLLIGLGFMTLIEGAAGFGTPGALAAPLLLGFGFPPIAAALFGLYFNAPQPPFGAVGTPIIGGIASVLSPQHLGASIEQSAFLLDVAGWSAVITGTTLVGWGALGIYLLIYGFGADEERTLLGAWHATRPVLPFALALGVITGGTQWLLAWFFGPELPNIGAGFATLGVGLYLAQHNILTPTRPWRFPARETWPAGWLGGLDHTEEDDESERATPSILMAWLPYMLVALGLLVTRWPGLGIGTLLQSYSLDLEQILGQEISFRLRYLYLPGVIPFIPVAILTAWLHGMRPQTVAQAWQTSLRQILPVTLTLIVAVSMTQIMIRSGTNPQAQPGMMEALSALLAQSAGQVLPFIAPWLGALGSFVTGSSTSSNILFSVLQHDAAADLNLSRTLMVALQNVGSGIGNMVSILNIAAICGVIRLTGMEGDLLRKMLPPTLLYATLAGAFGLLLAVLAPIAY